MWPTPQAGDFRTASENEKRNTPNLNVVVKMIPIPTARSWKSPSDCPNRQGARDIQTIAKMFATPCAGDAKGSHGGGNGRSLRTDCGGQLNPDWVEWLMGVPQGWTDIDKDLPIPEYNPQWYDTEPQIPRTATGIAHRVDRLKSLGNMVVPYQFYPVVSVLSKILIDLSDGFCRIS